MSSDAITSWLDAETERIWLLAEQRLRRLQRAGLRSALEQPALPELEQLLAHRRLATQRGPDDVELDIALAACESQVAATRPAAVIGQLAGRLDLRPIELDVLGLLVASTVDPPLLELFGVLRGPGTRRGLDLAFVADLFGISRTHRIELLQVLDPERPLLRWGLIIEGNREAPLAYRPLGIAHDVVGLLFGSPTMSTVLAAAATLVAAAPTLDELVLDAPLLQQLTPIRDGLAAAGGTQTAPWIVLWGPPGAGRRTIACSLAAAAGRPTLVLDPSRCAPEELAPVLRLGQREALVRGAALSIGPFAPDSPAARVILAQLHRYPDLVFLAVEAIEPPRLLADRAVTEIALGPLSIALSRVMWSRALAAAPLAAGVELESLSAAFRLTPGDILAAVADARGLATTAGRPIERADLRRGIERRLRTQLGGAVHRITDTHGWEDLVLPDEDLDRLREFIGRRRHAGKVYDEWGLAGRIRYGKGMIALFSGPPGTGKTMAAGVIAQALDLDLYRIDLSQVVSKWAGETEKQLARVFDVAERTQAVLLFDEADSLFARRGDAQESRDRFANLTVNYLLQRLEEYPGVAILTTNKEASLDEALQRRLSMHLRLDVPEAPERLRLWRSFLPIELPGAATVDLGWISERFALTGGYIKNAAVRAAFLAAGQDVPVDLAIVVSSIERELLDMGRVVHATTFQGYLPPVRRDAADIFLD